MLTTWLVPTRLRGQIGQLNCHGQIRLEIPIPIFPRASRFHGWIELFHNALLLLLPRQIPDSIYDPQCVSGAMVRITVHPINEVWYDRFLYPRCFLFCLGFVWWVQHILHTCLRITKVLSTHSRRPSKSISIINQALILTRMLFQKFLFRKTKDTGAELCRQASFYCPASLLIPIVVAWPKCLSTWLTLLCTANHEIRIHPTQFYHETS